MVPLRCPRGKERHRKKKKRKKKQKNKKKKKKKTMSLMKRSHPPKNVRKMWKAP